MIDPQLPDQGPPPVSSTTLRQFAGLWILIVGGLGCWEALMRAHPIRAVFLVALAALVGLLGMVKPPAIRPLFVGLMAVSMPIGWVVSHALLAFLFYVVFTPVGLLFKLDRPRRVVARYCSDSNTYWEPKPAANEIRSYFHQS